MYIKKILGALQDLPAYQHSQCSPISQIMAGLAVLVSWQILKGPQDFFHTFNMALYHKWDVKNDFPNLLQFLSLISDSLSNVNSIETFENVHRNAVHFKNWSMPVQSCNLSQTLYSQYSAMKLSVNLFGMVYFILMPCPSTGPEIFSANPNF